MFIGMYCMSMCIYMSCLFRYCDGMTVVNKREYFVFQTIYNHICKIVRANSKRGNYFYAKSYIGSAKHLYAYAEWLTSFFCCCTYYYYSRDQWEKQRNHWAKRKRKKTMQQKKWNKKTLCSNNGNLSYFFSTCLPRKFIYLWWMNNLCANYLELIFSILCTYMGFCCTCLSSFLSIAMLSFFRYSYLFTS